jgi:hypothetical protein
MQDLVKIRQTVAESLKRLPEYTCLETVARTDRQMDNQTFKAVDTLRFEVTQIGEKEFYSLPGGKFQDDVTKFVGNGMVSSGQFALAALSVFVDQSPEIKYAGEEMLKGRKMLRYNYRIPFLSGGWTLALGGQKVVVASHGSFWADADTLDLVRLERFADDIPPELTFAQARTAIDYGKVRIGAIDVLLPQTAEVVLTRRNREMYINRAEFSQCRAYWAQSTVQFGDPEELRQFQLPANLTIVLELDEAIDAAANVPGDPITARVVQDVKSRNQVVIPKGAVVRGRIRQLNQESVALEFAELEFENQRAVFTAVLERVDKGTSITNSTLPGVGVLAASGLPAGLRTTWRSIKPGTARLNE